MAAAAQRLQPATLSPSFPLVLTPKNNFTLFVQKHKKLFRSVEWRNKQMEKRYVGVDPLK